MTDNKTPQNYAMLASRDGEHGDQVAVFAYVNDLFHRRCYHAMMTDEQRATCERYDWDRLTFAVPNGAFLAGDKTMRQRRGLALKNEGVKAGTSDILCLVPSGAYRGLAIEMKKAKGGVVSDEQTKFGIAAVDAGYYWKVCKGYLEAIACIEWYVKGAYGA